MVPIFFSINGVTTRRELPVRSWEAMRNATRLSRGKKTWHLKLMSEEWWNTLTNAWLVVGEWVVYYSIDGDRWIPSKGTSQYPTKTVPSRKLIDSTTRRAKGGVMDPFDDRNVLPHYHVIVRTSEKSWSSIINRHIYLSWCRRLCDFWDGGPTTT